MQMQPPANYVQYQGGGLVTQSPIDILNLRLASGEITIDEFERLRSAIGGASAQRTDEAPQTVETGIDAIAPVIDVPPAIAEQPPETEAQRMLRRAREWQEQQAGSTSSSLTLTGVASRAGSPVRQGPNLPDGAKPLLIGAGVGVIGLALLAGLAGGSSCEVTNVSSRTEMLYIDGFDFGVVVKATIKNTGSDGTMNILATLSTSEDTYERVRPAMLSAGEIRDVEFQFEEPTINVNEADLQAVVRCDTA